MIADLDETIRKLLREEIPIKNSEVDISFEQPKRENSVRWTKPTLNIFLYDVRENNVLRQHQWERVQNGNGGNALAHLKRSPLRVDCKYMITSWAADPEDEHRLLTRCLLALFRFPILPEERLQGSLSNPTFDIQARLAMHDKLTNPAEVWSALDNEMRPSVSYVITLALDPWKEITGPVVRTFSLYSGQSLTLPGNKIITEDTRAEMVFIGGTVRDSSRKGLPASGVDVAIKGSGLFSTTDDDGRFTLGSMLPGDYTLIAMSKDAKPIQKSIVVPTKDGDYDLEL